MIKNLISWQALSRLGPINNQVIQACKQHAQALDLFSMTRIEQANLGLSQSQITRLNQLNLDQLATEVQQAQDCDQHVLVPSSSAYPSILLELAYPPPILYARGDLYTFSFPMLAMIGSRQATPSGLLCAKQWAAVLSQSGLTIVSGLAKGIDGAAHAGSAAVRGRSIAVLGNGLAQIYPRIHTRLADEILEHRGILLSEWPPYTTPRPEHFPRRNRIISGLAKGVVVIEAALPSGSLITAQYALEQGRDVFVVPGALDNPNKAGCHYLIKQGALLVDEPREILQELKVNYNQEHVLKKQVFQEGIDARSSPARLASKTKKLLACFTKHFETVEELAYKSGFSREEVNRLLMDLEMAGLVMKSMIGYQRKG